MAKKIYLQNRYYDNEIYLEQQEDDVYKLCLNKKILYTRHGLEKDNTIYFVDPEGGPFMQIGSVLPGTGKNIVKIEKKDKDYIFTVK